MEMYIIPYSGDNPVLYRIVEITLYLAHQIIVEDINLGPRSDTFPLSHHNTETTRRNKHSIYLRFPTFIMIDK